MNSARFVRHLFYRTPPDNCFCSREKIFYRKNLGKKGGKTGNYSQEKQQQTQKKNLNNTAIYKTRNTQKRGTECGKYRERRECSLGF